MMYARGKNCKSETPNRGAVGHKIGQLVGVAKRSDPFLKDLREVYDKENVHPNVKENRVKSQHNKGDCYNQSRSPRQKATFNKSSKSNSQQGGNLLKPPCKEGEGLDIHSKFSYSSELPKGNHIKVSNRKNTQKEECGASHFQEEYYNAKEERRQKKMRVTLKDISKKRKSIQESDQEYMTKYQEETKDSLTKELIGTLKKQLIKSNEKTINEESSSKDIECVNDYHCFNHPEKKATHRLLEANNCTYCQKCAVSFVTKGHRMEHIGGNNRLPTRSSDLKEERIERLKDFLFEVDRLEPCFKQFQGQINDYRSLASQRYDSEKDVLDGYYNRIREEVQISHEKAILNLRLFFQSIFEELEKSSEILSRQAEEIKTIKDDILPNINCIVEQQRVTQESFEEVISNYTKNLRAIQLNLKQLSQCDYHLYCYGYQKSHSVLLNLRDLIAPEIRMIAMGESQETQRKLSQQESEKRLEHFRLSFGKETPGQQRT